MVHESHLAKLREGVRAWNEWRAEQTHAIVLHGVDLSGANLTGVNLAGAFLYNANFSCANLSNAIFEHAVLSYANLSGASLTHALLYSADLPGANLSKANLSYASLVHADLSSVRLSGANLSGANLTNANLSNTNLQGADLKGVDLTGAVLRETDFTDAILSDCKVYSAAVWDMKGKPKEQKNLVISRPGEAVFTVDNLEVAHFIYMIRHHKKLREVIRESTSKVVLILGRFTEKRRKVLEAVQDELRKQTDADGKAKYIPVIFDFPPAESRDIMETVQILVGLSRFVIADISDPKGVLVELTAIVPHWDVPVKLVVDQTHDTPVKMLDSLTKYKWIDNEIYQYSNSGQLCQALKTEVIDPLEKMVARLDKVKATGFTITSSDRHDSQ